MRKENWPWGKIVVIMAFRSPTNNQPIDVGLSPLVVNVMRAGPDDCGNELEPAGQPDNNGEKRLPHERAEVARWGARGNDVLIMCGEPALGNKMNQSRSRSLHRAPYHGQRASLRSWTRLRAKPEDRGPRALRKTASRRGSQ
jgi:hypothetical protein